MEQLRNVQLQAEKNVPHFDWKKKQQNEEKFDSTWSISMWENFHHHDYYYSSVPIASSTALNSMPFQEKRKKSI